jgi:hypothetical protein
MELNELVGKRILSGVDMDNGKVKTWGDNYEDCEVVRFVLDDKTYTVVEDPEGGYRSSMRYIDVSNDPISNMFPGIEVMASMRPHGDYEKNDVLELMDTTTAKIVLSVGTGNTGDYYPYWVAEFTPENMATNQ